ncbi:MAG: methyltransferase domain-containing protein, partial [Myxococcota bacterium]
WISIDPNRTAEVDSAGIREVRAIGAEDIDLPESSVDAVFSCNALQFIDVERTMPHIRRILAPGGLFFAHFGPIWSGVDGHQLEYVEYQGRSLGFWKDTFVPPWGHLMYDPPELKAVLASALPDELADLIVHHTFVSSTINRMFFEDYIDVALDSGLEWVVVKATNTLDYSIETPNYDSELLKPVDIERLEERIERKRGRKTKLGPRDIFMVLRKRASTL